MIWGASGKNCRTEGQNCKKLLQKNGKNFLTCVHPKTSLAPGTQDPLHATVYKVSYNVSNNVSYNNGSYNLSYNVGYKVSGNVNYNVSHKVTSGNTDQQEACYLPEKQDVIKVKPFTHRPSHLVGHGLHRTPHPVHPLI